MTTYLQETQLKKYVLTSRLLHSFQSLNFYL